jgi:hypothetical protein
MCRLYYQNNRRRVSMRSWEVWGFNVKATRSDEAQTEKPKIHQIKIKKKYIILIAFRSVFKLK